MRHLLAALLLTGCAPHLPAPSLSAILSAPAVRCFDSYGIDVRGLIYCGRVSICSRQFT